MDQFNQFVMWERATRDTIDVKKTYIDMADDLVAGILLSQIVYWYLPKEDGSSKLRVEKDGQFWIAKGREDWWDETRISPKQFDRCIKLLEDKGLVVKETFKFDGNPTVHIRLVQERFMEMWNVVIVQPIQNPYKKKRKDRGEGKIDITQKVITSNDVVFPEKGITKLPSHEYPDGEIGSSPKGNNKVPEEGKSLTKITSKTSFKDFEEEESTKEGDASLLISPLKSHAIEVFETNAPRNGLDVATVATIVEKMKATDFDFDSEIVRQTCLVTFDKLESGEVYHFPNYFIAALKEKSAQIFYAKNKAKRPDEV